jgi:hypothetical protein
MNPSKSFTSKQNDNQRSQDFYSHSKTNSSTQKKKNENENPYTEGTVKFKIFNIEKTIFEVANMMNNHKIVINSLKDEKENVEEVTKKNSKIVTEILNDELSKVENEIKRHFEFQKKENEDLQNEIIALKTEKTKLAGEIIASQRKIAELEMLIGIEYNEQIDKPLK